MSKKDLLIINRNLKIALWVIVASWKIPLLEVVSNPIPDRELLRRYFKEEVTCQHCMVISQIFSLSDHSLVTHSQAIFKAPLEYPGKKCLLS